MSATESLPLSDIDVAILVGGLAQVSQKSGKILGFCL